MWIYLKEFIHISTADELGNCLAAVSTFQNMQGALVQTPGTDKIPKDTIVQISLDKTPLNGTLRVHVILLAVILILLAPGFSYDYT